LFYNLKRVVKMVKVSRGITIMTKAGQIGILRELPEEVDVLRSGKINTNPWYAGVRSLFARTFVRGTGLGRVTARSM
jgi:hypothetical protein